MANKTFQAWSADRGYYTVTPAQVAASYAASPSFYTPGVVTPGQEPAYSPSTMERATGMAGAAGLVPIPRIPPPGGYPPQLGAPPYAQAGVPAGEETKIPEANGQSMWDWLATFFDPNAQWLEGQKMVGGAAPATYAGLAGAPPAVPYQAPEAGVEVAEAGFGALLAPLGAAAAWIGGKGLLPYLVKMGLAGGVASGAWGIIANLFGLNPDEAIKAAGKKKARRYSIGRNPRLGTLIKVTKRCTGLMERYDKQLKKIRPRSTTRYVGGGPRYLSSVERKALKAGA